MNTNALIGVIVAIVVVGGGAWYLTTQGTPSPEGPEAVQQEAAGEGTFAELMMRSGSWKCDITTTIEEAPSTGVAYIADGKIRADFTSTPAATGQPVTSHMISADGYVYTWSDMYPQGMRIMIPEGEATVDTEVGGMAYDSRVDYDCQPVAANASLFVAPSDVTFMELGANGMPSYPLPQ